MTEGVQRSGGRRIAIFVGIGLASGFLSGLFGVGGGTVIVPLLVLLAVFPQRLAAGTSTAAIIPTAVAGVISYAINDAVAWIPGLIIVVGSIVGAQIGVALLHRISEPMLRWIFVGFLAVVVVGLFVVVPSRDAELELTWLSGGGLVLLGLVTGILSGLIGVGGGVIVVPVLMLLFGVSDLIAKGTSLMMMIPTAISGTVGNLRRGNVDVVAGVCVGLGAAATTALGAWIATMLDPLTANILFAVFLVVIAVQMAQKALRAMRRRG